MTKSNAPVFAPYLEHPGHTISTHATRWLLISTAMVLAACSSTPLPEWPASPSVSTLPTSTTQPAPQPSQSAASATPVAPKNYLEALPYSAAIANLFPDPQERYSTPGLSEGRSSFTTNAELAELLNNLSQQDPGDSPQLAVLNYGNAQSGAPIYALVATKARAASPFALDESGRPTILIVAGQQGTDVAATEAALALAKELGTGGLLEHLLDRLNIIVVPRANPDGFNSNTANTADGTDLRLDHLQLKTPEARFLAKLARDYRPSALIDAGEFAAIKPTLERFNAVRANDIGLQYGSTPNGHEFVSKAAREWLQQPANDALSQADLRVDWAFEAAGNDAQSGFAMGSIAPTSLRNTSSLKNMASLEVQSRGSDLDRTHIQRRVHSHVKAMTAALENAAQRAGDLRQVQTFATRDIASHACHGTLTVEAQPAHEQRDITLIDAPSAQLEQKTVAWSNSLAIKKPRTRNNACGYLLSANAVQAAERLEMLGLTVQRVAELSPVEAETYQAIADIHATPQVSITRKSIEAAPGSFYVSMNQPLALLAAAALEPDTPYSFYSNGLLSDLNETARVVTPPQIVFDEE